MPSSRQHCRIQLSGDAVILSDLGSTNGTFIAGQRIEGTARLTNGTHITVGSFSLRYEQRDERELEDEERLNAELRQAAEYVRAINGITNSISQRPLHPYLLVDFIFLLSPTGRKFRSELKVLHSALILRCHCLAD